MISGSIRPGRANDLLDDTVGILLLVGTGRRAEMKTTLLHPLLELLKAQGAVVARRRQPKAELDQRVLAPLVARRTSRGVGGWSGAIRR